MTSSALAISIAALALSTFTFAYNRQVGRRDLLLRVHDQLVALDRQEGRRILFSMSENDRKPEDLSTEEFRLVNHSLASLDVMGFLFSRRYIPQEDALALWGPTAVRAFTAGEAS